MELIMSITKAIQLLKTYKGPLGLTLHGSASEKLIIEVEKAYGITLPEDFKTLYRFTDGFETVEDMFNMIPLNEIIDNRKEQHHLWIAEYMIYSDMWELEINPGIADKYSISIDDYHKGKIVLTHSLPEFIERLLKGGVFGLGGLYRWRDEIKAQLYGNTNPDEMKPVFWVYRECMRRGLMTKQRVIQEADWIISTESEPDHFFIELSLSRDVNELITILSSKYLTDDIVSVRAFFGETSLKLLIDDITLDHVIAILDDYSHDERFTAFERNKMFEFIVESDYLYDIKPDAKAKKQLYEEVKTFFENYRVFKLFDYQKWDTVNTQL